MDAKIIAIDQSLDLESGTMIGWLVLRLPDGVMARVQAEGDVLDHVQGLLQRNNGPEPARWPPGVALPTPPEPVPPPVPQPSEPDPPEMEFDPTPPPELPMEAPPEPSRLATVEGIIWRKLPDSVLSETMKQTFAALGVKERLTKEELASTAEEVKRLAIAQASSAPSEPKVSWSNSPPRDAPEAKPIRFPRKTDAGYPVLPADAGGADPGEVADADEDGVGQIS